jgi:hypothetical protein
MAYVNVDIDLRELHDDELIEELEDRGWVVLDKNHKEIMIDEENLEKDMIDWFRRGNAKEALIALERIYPDMRGISDRVV